MIYPSFFLKKRQRILGIKSPSWESWSLFWSRFEQIFSSFWQKPAPVAERICVTVNNAAYVKFHSEHMTKRKTWLCGLTLQIHFYCSATTYQTVCRFFVSVCVCAALFPVFSQLSQGFLEGDYQRNAASRGDKRKSLWLEAQFRPCLTASVGNTRTQWVIAGSGESTFLCNG